MIKALVITSFFLVGSTAASFALQEQEGKTDQPRTQPKVQQDQEKDKPKKKRIVIPGDDDNAFARRDFMRIKMQSSQFILEGLTTNDFTLVNKGIKQIKDMTKSEKWVAIDNKFYRELVDDFEAATEKLEAAAKTGNIDAAAMRYFQLSTQCIDCHKHIREAAYEL